MNSVAVAERASSNLLRVPAEWEKHFATWIAWPTNETDWPGKFEPIKWVYAEIVRVLSQGERVDIICQSLEQKNSALECIKAHNSALQNVHFHLLHTNRSWLRDSAPTAIFSSEKLCWMSWHFNAWAKYDDYELDQKVPEFVAKKTNLSLIHAHRFDDERPFVCEGGAIDSDGEGTLLVTEECFLSDTQVRNPGLTKADYEKTFADTLGIEKVIWLKAGIAGDDTHGHIDDVCRFVSPRTVVLAYEDNISSENYQPSKENLRRLNLASDAKGRSIEVILLPMPDPLYFNDQLLPASYANFYIANGVVLVPTFNDPKDRLALNILAQAFPTRAVVGVHCSDLVLGLGTLHCLTQQQPSEG